MAKTLGFLFGVGLIVVLVMLIVWPIWLLWCYVMPALWPTGPTTLTDPGYGVFLGAWLLFGFIGRQIFGSSSSSKN